MPKSRGDGAKITNTLSRYFDENVRLVAGVCSRCYLEGDDDVKIVAVNRKFLKQTEDRRRAVKFLRDNDASAPSYHNQTVFKNENLQLPITTYGCDDFVTNNVEHKFRLNDGKDDHDHDQTVSSSRCIFGELLTDRRDNERPKTEVCRQKRAPEIRNVNLDKLKFEFPASELSKSGWYRATKSSLEEEIKTEDNLGPVRKMREPLWSPPRSPHNLIEESLFRDPWSLLVATIFLNKTSCKCARPRVEEFLRDFGNPNDVLRKHASELEKYFLDLGLFKRRAEQVWRMSYDYVHKNWRNARELYGIGKYGDDAYRMFVLGDLEVEPTDRFLKIYRDWAKLTEEEHKKKPNVDDDPPHS